MRTRLATALRVCALLGVTAGLGCQRRDPLAEKISAPDERAYNLWLSLASRDRDAAQRAELIEARNEIRLGLMAREGVSGADALGEAFSRRVNGVTVREFLLMGLHAKQDHLEAEQALLVHTIERQSSLRTRPDDRESIAYLQFNIAQNRERLEVVEGQLAATRARAARLGPAAGATSATPAKP